MKKLPQIKLKNQLALVNAFSKLFTVLVLIFIIPWLVSRISINDTDENLVKKLDEMLMLVDSLGIENFIDKDAGFQAYGSYNILKEEYISIEKMDNDTLVNYIDYSQRLIENEVVDYRVLSYSFVVDDEYYLIEIGKSISTILLFEKQLKRMAFLFMIILLAITIVIELSLIQYLLRPLDAIVKKLKQTQHPNTFNYKKINTRTADFKYLEETIHSLMHKIEVSFNNEREFTSNVSHELLTPISIIKSKLDNVIMDGDLSDEDLQKVFDSKKTLGRLTKMIRTLLTMSRIENEEYLLNTRADLVDILKNVAAELEDKTTAKNLEVRQEWKIPSVNILGNTDLLFNLFYNLLNNSIKYTDVGTITLQSGKLEGQTAITITDTGQGIEQEHLPYVFSRFKKFKKGKNNFGLGLALAKKICDYHNITIKVESEINKGTTFQLFMPK